MVIEGAIITEQRQTFAVVCVKQSAVANQTTIQDSKMYYSRFFPNMPIILMTQNHKGVPTYYGRRDIAKFMASVPFNRIPWKKFTFE